MSFSDESELSRLVSQLDESGCDAATDLLPKVYDDLREIASRFLQNEKSDHTLQPTALVHEAYIRLAKGESSRLLKAREEFLRLASVVMRHILVNHARDRKRLKRGGAHDRIELRESVAIHNEPEIDVLALDEALNKLTSLDPRKTEIVELRYFAGCTLEETAGVIGISTAQVKREWSFTRAWLHRELGLGDSDDTRAIP